MPRSFRDKHPLPPSYIDQARGLKPARVLLVTGDQIRIALAFAGTSIERFAELARSTAEDIRKWISKIHLDELMPEQRAGLIAAMKILKMEPVVINGRPGICWKRDGKDIRPKRYNYGYTGF